MNFTYLPSSNQNHPNNIYEIYVGCIATDV